MNLPGMMNVPQHDRTVAGFNVTLTLRKTSTHFAVSTPSYESSLFVRAVSNRRRPPFYSSGANGVSRRPRANDSVTMDSGA